MNWRGRHDFPAKSSRDAFGRELIGCFSHSERGGEEKNLLLGIETRSSSPKPSFCLLN